MMNIRLHPHARERLLERGVREDEIIAAVNAGECFPAKYGRTGFRKNFPFGGTWRGREYSNKQVEVFATPEGDDWLVITVIARYY